ncbi:MAG: DUF2127 domain-containing protein [Acidimicrobiales bacterium]
MRKPWWLPEGWHAETWVCSMRGHVFAPAGDDERLHRAEMARCLRCDAWLPPGAVDNDADPVPWPRRGEELHEAILLRLVAVNRAFHALVLVPAGLFLGWLWLRLDVLSPQAASLAEGLAQVSQEVGHVGGQLNSAATRVAALDRSHVLLLAAFALGLGLVEGVEAVGLWQERRWAEYITVVATASLLPIEVLELTRHVTVLKAGGFAINLAVIAYLVWAKRLFGVRGGPQARAADVEAVAAAPHPQKARRAGDVDLRADRSDRPPGPAHRAGPG